LQLENSKKQNKVWRRCHGFCVKSLGWYFSILISAEKKWKCLFLSEGTLAHLEPLSGPVQRKLIMVINGPQLFFSWCRVCTQDKIIYLHLQEALLGKLALLNIKWLFICSNIEWICTYGKDTQIIIRACSNEEKRLWRYIVKQELLTKYYIYFCFLTW
jgi:hypothetical protein